VDEDGKDRSEKRGDEVEHAVSSARSVVVQRGRRAEGGVRFELLSQHEVSEGQAVVVPHCDNVSNGPRALRSNQVPLN
jgi:hypothetical protein